MARLIVFTDIDGTLLDSNRLRWRPAEPAVRGLRARGIPVVLCTSRTRAEVLPLRKELGLRDPFVMENGGAICIPRNYFPFALPTARVEAGFQVLELGQRYQNLVQALDEAAKTSGIEVRGFSRMSEKEVAASLGTNRAGARLARQREYDEPFLLEKGTSKQRERFFRWLQQRGLRWQEDGRFHHLMGDNDKGAAVSRLIELYRQQYGIIHTLGLGDAASDLDFLSVVDSAVVVAGADGSHDPELRRRLPQARLEPAPGPAGWNRAILDILEAVD
ncbi:MAG: HAD-IIB family hydrolase [Candidatus Acidiferrales bacterium]